MLTASQVVLSSSFAPGSSFTKKYKANGARLETFLIFDLSGNRAGILTNEVKTKPWWETHIAGGVDALQALFLLEHAGCFKEKRITLLRPPAKFCRVSLVSQLDGAERRLVTINENRLQISAVDGGVGLEKYTEIKNWRFSGSESSKRVRLICSWSASIVAKSGLVAA